MVVQQWQTRRRWTRTIAQVVSELLGRNRAYLVRESGYVSTGIRQRARVRSIVTTPRRTSRPQRSAQQRAPNGRHAVRRRASDVRFSHPAVRWRAAPVSLASVGARAYDGQSYDGASERRSSTGMPVCAQRPCPSVHVAVRSLDASPPCSRVWWTRSRGSPRRGKRPLVDAHAAAGGVRIDARHPCPHAVRVEDVIPTRVQRVRGLHPPAVAADLDHLGRPVERLIRARGMRGARGDSSEPDRAGLDRIERIGDVELLELARPKQPRTASGHRRRGRWRHQRRDRAEWLKRR